MLQRLKNWLFGTPPRERGPWTIRYEYRTPMDGFAWVAYRGGVARYVTPDKQRLEAWLDQQDNREEV